MAAETVETWKEQKRKALPCLLFQTILAVVLTATWLYGGYHYCDFIPIPKSMGVKDIWIYYTRCCVLPCTAVLFFSIIAVSNKRGSTPAGNPFAGKEHFLQMEKNILTNTVEQTMLFLFVNIILVTYLDRLEMKILPLFASYWVIGRIIFNIGYRFSYLYRTLGMLCNFFSTMFFFGLAFYFVYSRGLWFGLVTTTTASMSGTGQSTKNVKAEL